MVKLSLPVSSALLAQTCPSMIGGIYSEESILATDVFRLPAVGCMMMMSVAWVMGFLV